MRWLEVSVSNTLNLPLTVYKTHVSPTIQIRGDPLMVGLMGTFHASKRARRRKVPVLAPSQLPNGSCIIQINEALIKS